MAKITRKNQKIFGSAAGTDQIAEFGSLAAGVPAFTTDPETIQALSNYLTGWYGAVIGSNSPAIEDMNALCYLFAYQLAYVLQAGVAEWDDSTTYYIGSMVTDGAGGLYISITNANLNNAVTDTTNWAPMTTTLAQYGVTVGNSAGQQQVANTNLLGRLAAKIGNFTVAISNATPAVITKVSHGLNTYDTVYFTTTGALPTGLTASTIYFVTVVTADTFKVSTTLVNAVAGTFVNTSSAGSGVHTCVFGGLAPKVGGLIDQDISASAAIQGSKVQAASSSNVGTLAYYKTESVGPAVWTFNNSGNTTASVALVFERLGNSVTVKVPTFNATADASDRTLSWGGTAPSAYRPSVDTYLPIRVSTQGGASLVIGLFKISTLGDVAVSLVNTGGTWGAGVGGVTLAAAVSYSVA